MSQKNIKKIRRILRQEQQLLALKIIKPKNRFIPSWIHMLILKMFIRVK